MDFDFRYSEQAKIDLEHTLNYIANTLQNPTAARNLGQKINEAINTACIFPQSGLFVENSWVRDDSVRKLLVGSYVLYYKALEMQKIIYIVRIVYAPRNQDNVLA